MSKIKITIIILFFLLNDIIWHSTTLSFIFFVFKYYNRLHTKEDVEKYLEIPNLGVIPYFED